MLKENKLKPILKWAGGKTSELPLIHQYMPKEFNNFYEPFLGGGALWLTIDIEHKMYVNDFSKDLINLYNNVRQEEKGFYLFLSEFNTLWKNISDFSKINKDKLEGLYFDFKNDELSYKELSTQIESIVINDKSLHFYFKNDHFLGYYRKYVLDKFKRTKANEQKKGDLPKDDYIKNIETAFKSSAYMFIRHLYNNVLTKKDDYGSDINAAIYFLIRDLSYSGMFRFNDKNEFNVPYGGIGYNKKDFKHKISHMKSLEIKKHFENSIIDQGDFYNFMNKYPTQSEDFIFIDPPYDSEFSNYEGNEFSKQDQERLAKYLIEECKGKWMVIIKYTDFIHSLYNKKGINIIAFDKRYAVSFMDRNIQEVTHLLIRNYL